MSFDYTKYTFLSSVYCDYLWSRMFNTLYLSQITLVNVNFIFRSALGLHQD